MALAGPGELPSAGSRVGRRRYQPDRRLVAGGWVILAALAFAALHTDTAGRILLGLAGAALLTETLRSTVKPVSLAIEAEGLELLEGWRAVRLCWAEVLKVRAVRLGHLLTASALEVETPDRAYLVSQFRLGAPVSAVVAEIEAVRPA
jgi:hypothetical protein